MGILMMLVPLAVLIAVVSSAAFWWACRDQQFDDLETPAYKLLLDDDPMTFEEPDE